MTRLSDDHTDHENFINRGKMKKHIMSGCHFFIHSISILLLLFTVFIYNPVNAEIIDPEQTIRNKGYNSNKMGEDGKTMFYFLTERAETSRIESLEKEIVQLPKDPAILPVCNMLVEAAMAKHGSSFDDIFLGNYGYQGATIACVIKYKRGNITGTQLVYTKEADAEVYQVIAVD